MHLYEIDGRIAQVIENGFALDEATGEVFTCDELEELEASREAKLEAVGLFIKDLNAEVAAFKAEEKALTERRKAKERRVEQLKEYLAFSMQAHGDKKLDTPKVRLSFRKSTRIEITDEKLVPDEFKTVETVVKIDKKKLGAAIDKAMKDGGSIKGAEHITRQSLIIK
nr:MAG: hypothetical protein [Bacteriophage sp.]